MQYINDTWGSDAINAAAEVFEFDKSRLAKDNISKLYEDEIDELFRDLVEFVMEGFGIDDYGEIHDILKDDVGMDEEDISIILE